MLQIRALAPISVRRLGHELRAELGEVRPERGRLLLESLGRVAHGVGGVAVRRRGGGRARALAGRGRRRRCLALGASHVAPATTDESSNGLELSGALLLIAVRSKRAAVFTLQLRCPWPLQRVELH